MRLLYAITTLLFLCLTLTACEGPVGPEGPLGPAGPTGATGPQGPAGQDGASASILSLSGTLDSDGAGGVVIENASLEDLVLNCWTSEDGVVWVLVALDTNSGISCGAAQDGDDVGVLIVNGVPGWFWLIVAIVEE